MIERFTPVPALRHATDVVLRDPGSTARTGPDYATLDFDNPFLGVRRPPRPPPSAEAVRADLEAALAGDPRSATTRAALRTALIDLQGADLGALEPERVDAMFRKLAAAFDTWPDTVWARDLIAVAVATFALHITWKNGGARTLDALAPATLEAFRALARHVDRHAETYGRFRDEARADARRREAGDAMAVLTDRATERSDLSLEAALDALIAQTRKIAGGPADPASQPTDSIDGSAAAESGVRAMTFAVTLYAESRKRAALHQLRQGADLSQAAIMRLQEELQAANQLILAMSQILRKEGELGEQLARNIA